MENTLIITLIGAIVANIGTTIILFIHGDNKLEATIRHQDNKLSLAIAEGRRELIEAIREIRAEIKDSKQ
jgi:hypothetical protein